MTCVPIPILNMIFVSNSWRVSEDFAELEPDIKCFEDAFFSLLYLILFNEFYKSILEHWGLCGPR